MAPRLTRVLLVLATVAAVTVGAVLRPVPRPTIHMTSREAAAAWAQAGGLVLTGARDLTNTGDYTLFRFATPEGCRLAAVPLGRADEIVPTLRARIDPEEWGESKLLLDHAGRLPDTTLTIQLLRVLARLRLGHAPQAVLLIEPAQCLSQAALDRLPEWPAP